MAVCVSVIGKDNGPIFFKCRPKTEDLQAVSFGAGSGGMMSDLQYSFIVSSALDIIEERVQIGASGGSQAFKANAALNAVGGQQNPGDGFQVVTRELYLGALTAQEEYKVYGYMTNTKIKFVIIVEETMSIPLRENDIRMMFRKLHGAFCDLMSNPFYLPGTEINSKRFESVVNSIMAGQ